MEPSKPNHIDLTGVFGTAKFRDCGLTKIVREELTQHGAAIGAEMERYLNSVPCSLMIGSKSGEAILTFKEHVEPTIIRISFESLTAAQRDMLMRSVPDSKPLTSTSALTMPEATLSQYERITNVIASGLERLNSAKMKPTPISDGYRSPRDYALLARGLLAERYAAAGQGKEAATLYNTLCRQGSEMMRALPKDFNNSGEAVSNVVGELFGCLISGAARGSNKELLSLSMGAILNALPRDIEPGYQKAFLSFVDASLVELITSKHHRTFPDLLEQLSLLHQLSVLQSVFYQIDARVTRERFDALQIQSEKVIARYLAELDSFDDSDHDPVEATRQACALSGVRLNHRDVDEILSSDEVNLDEGQVVGAIAGVLLSSGRSGEAHDLASKFLRDLDGYDGDDRRGEARAFIHEILRITPHGYALATEALQPLSSSENVISHSFEIILAAYSAKAIHWADGALDKWLDDLPQINSKSPLLLKRGSYHGMVAEALRILRADIPEFEYRGVVFTRIFDNFADKFIGSRNDLALMQRVFTLAGEYGLIEVLSRMKAYHRFSPLRRYELSLAAIGSRALEGEPELARKVVREARKILIDSAIDASRGEAVGFEPLLHEDNLIEGYLYQERRLVGAVLKANLSPESEELADSLVGGSLLSGPNVLPKILYELAGDMRRWEFREDKPTISD